MSLTVSSIAILVFSSHVFGCFFFLLARVEHLRGDFNWADDAGILEQCEGDADVICAAAEYSSKISDQYVQALYWAVATLTTVGYGDIYPATLTGKILASLTMFLGIGMFALPAAILASAYYEEIQKKNFLVSIETITEIPLFAKLPIAALSKINQKLDPVILAAKKAVFNKGDKADSMYIIEFGHVEVVLDKPVKLGPGDYFGEMGLLGNTTRNATIRTLDEVKLLELTKEDLEELLEEHEVLFREIEDKISGINGK